MPNETEKLGRLERVDLRDVWSSEASDFTPWLAGEKNIELLGEAIGMELEVEAQEKNVGPFRADILCRETASSKWVLIENQLERTDHTHLGQLITYAAGLEAVTIVWVAHRFTEEHRSALDWLNRITDSDFNFFGLEVELWRIGESLAAPKFNVTSKPNDWSRSVTAAAHQLEAGELSETRQMQLEFWTGFREYATEHGDRIKPQKPFPQNWMNIAVGRTGFCLCAVCSTLDTSPDASQSHELRAEMVVLTSHDAEHFSLLESMKSDIENELGESLCWEQKEGVKQCKAFFRRSASLHNREHWAESYEWLVSKLDAMHKTFAPRIKGLP